VFKTDILGLDLESYRTILGGGEPLVSRYTLHFSISIAFISTDQ